MTTETNKAIVRRFIAEVINTGNVEQVADFVAPNCRESGDATSETALALMPCVGTFSLLVRHSRTSG